MQSQGQPAVLNLEALKVLRNLLEALVPLSLPAALNPHPVALSPEALESPNLLQEAPVQAQNLPREVLNLEASVHLSLLREVQNLPLEKVLQINHQVQAIRVQPLGATEPLYQSLYLGDVPDPALIPSTEEDTEQGDLHQVLLSL